MLKLLVSGLLLMWSSLAIADTDIRFDDGNFLKIKDGVVVMGDEQSAVHFQRGSDTLTVVDYKDKSYMPMEKESIKNSMDSVMQQMEAQLANVPEAQREMVRKMMQDRMPAMQDQKAAPDVSVRRTSERGEAAGFSCQMTDMIVDGTVAYKICTASAKSTGVPEEDLAAMHDAMDTVRALAESMPGGRNSGMGEVDMRKLGGVPIIFNDLKRNDTNKVTSISTDGLDPIVIPADFKQRRLEDMMKR